MAGFLRKLISGAGVKWEVDHSVRLMTSADVVAELEALREQVMRQQDTIAWYQAEVKRLRFERAA